MTKEKNKRCALRLFQKHNFENSKQAGLCLQLEYLGSGAFRDAYRIAHTDLLVKFPLGHDGKVHSRAEMRKNQKLGGYPFLKKHLPPVYYWNSKTGVLVTKYYPHAKLRRTWDAMGVVIGELLKNLVGVEHTDLWSGADNVRMDNGYLVFTDLGY